MQKRIRLSFLLLAIAFLGVPLNADIQHKVVLKWQSSSKDVKSYKVYRSTISGGYYGLIGRTEGVLSYTDSTVASGTTYYYVVSAVNKTGKESGYSAQAVATVP
jgi:fibronectin type 3 domain-containing protein